MHTYLRSTVYPARYVDFDTQFDGLAKSDLIAYYVILNSG